MTDEHNTADHDLLERAFTEHRPRLRSVAFRMLGTAADAEDALQDAWIKVNGAGAAEVQNIGAWLTTVVARVCLNQLRSRRRHPEEPMVHIPDPIIEVDAGDGPEQSAVLADGVGLALLVVLDSLTPDERLAFVLHDMFGVPFDEIAPMVQRTPQAARQLASRARRRVRDGAGDPEPDLQRQRAVVEAFFAASRDGDFDGLLRVLHPDVVLRSDGGTARPQLTLRMKGHQSVAGQAVIGARLAPFTHRALVNGEAGLIVAPHGQLQVVMAFSVSDDRIVAIDCLGDPSRLADLDVGDIVQQPGSRM